MRRTQVKDKASSAKAHEKHGPGSWAGRQSGGLDDTRRPTGKQGGHGESQGGPLHDPDAPGASDQKLKNPIDIES